MAVTLSLPAAPADGARKFDIRVATRECEPLVDADLRRFFPGSALTEPRLNRLREWSRIVVTCGDAIVAVATCQKTDVELRVPDVGLDESTACATSDVLHALSDALELTCLAGGCLRIILSPPPGSVSILERRGYRRVSEGCAGGWLEKTFA